MIQGFLQSLPSTKMLDLSLWLSSHPEVQIIKCEWLDIAGVLRSRLVPVPSFKHLIETKGYLSGSCADVTFPVDQSITPSLLEAFVVLGKIIPDTTSIRSAKYDVAKLGNAAAVCCTNWQSDVGDALSPRGLLMRTIKEAQKDHELKFLVGFEIEFCLMELDKQTAPLPKGPGMYNAHSFRNQYYGLLNECSAALTDAGIKVEQIHKEFGNTQFEFALAPLSPVEAVDACIFAKETIKDIAYRHKLVATFHPTPFVSDEGMATGQHIHISAAPTKEKSTFDPDKFLGGLMSHVRALCAIGMPNIDSYGRVEGGHMGAGAYVGWGTNNRDSPVRLVSQDHWEVRCNDGTANPYMMVAAIILSGLDGKSLVHKDNRSESPSLDQYHSLPASYHAYTPTLEYTPNLSDEEREHLGMTEKMPTTLKEALEAFKGQAEFWKKGLSEPLYDTYVSIREYEEETEGKKDVKERKLAMLELF